MPCVIGAGYGPRVAVETDQFVTAVPADVIKRADYTILPANREYGTPQNVAADITAGFAQLLAMRKKLPAFEEYLFAFYIQEALLVVTGGRQ